MLGDQRVEELLPQELERFLREAEPVAGLQHAHIVQVLEAGDVDGRPHFHDGIGRGREQDARCGGRGAIRRGQR